MSSKIESDLKKIVSEELISHGFKCDVFTPGDKFSDAVAAICAVDLYHPRECAPVIEELIDVLMGVSVKLEGKPVRSLAERLAELPEEK